MKNPLQRADRNRTVRKTSCLYELYFFDFLLLTVYMGWNLLISATGAHARFSVLGLFLYLLTVPCLIFTAGYEFSVKAQEENDDALRALLLRRLLLCLFLYVIFFALPLKLSAGLSLDELGVRILRGLDVQPAAGIFLSLAVFYALCTALRSQLQKLIFPVATVLGVLLLAVSMVPVSGGSYLLFDTLAGGDGSMRVFPVLPYAVYAFFGMWLGRRKYGFQLRGAVVTALVTAAGAVLYRTSLAPAARVLLPALPLYVLYGLCTLLTDSEPLHRRSTSLAAVSGLVFLGDSVLFYLLQTVFGFSFTNIFKGIGVLLVLILAGFAGVFLLIFATSLTDRITAWFAGSHKRKLLAYYLLYTAVFSLFVLAYLVIFLIKGRTLIQTGDAVSQYYPRAVYFARYIREVISSLLHGHFELPMFDFRLGMGSEVTYILEPLYFVYALFGPSHVEFTTNFLIILRFYLSGMAFSAMAFYFGKPYFATFFGSLVYIFCGYTISGVLVHWTFMVPMILMPLMIIAGEEIIKNGKWYLMPPLVALFLYSNYYFFYMCTLGLGIYFVVRFFCQDGLCRKTPLQFLRAGFTFVGTYALGAALAALPIVTNFGFYIGSGRGSGSVINTPSLFYYGPEWALKCAMTFISQKDSPGEWLRLGFLPVALLALIVLFARKGRKELKILFFCCVVGMLLPVFAYISSGFNAVLNRWCFLLALLMGYIVTECLPDLLAMTRGEITASLVVGVLYTFMARYGYIYRSRYMMVAAYLLLITLAVFLCLQAAGKNITDAFRKVALTLLSLAVVFANSYIYFNSANVIREYLVPGQTEARVTDTPLAAMNQVEDDSFYRSAVARFPYNSVNASCLLDYNGIYYFWSTMNGNIKEYLRAIGNTGSTQTQLLGFSNHLLANAPACVKYYAQFDDVPFTRPLPFSYEPVQHVTVDGRDVTIYQSDLALPIGYTFSSQISEDELMHYSVLERQEVMAQCTVLEGENVLPPAVDLTTDVVTLPITDTRSSNVALQENSVTVFDPETADPALKALAQDPAQPDGDLTLTFRGIPNAETCLVLKGASMEGTINDERVNITVKYGDETVGFAFPSTTFRYQIGQDDYVFNLGYHEEAVTECTIHFDSWCEITFDSLEMQAIPMEHAAEWLSDRKETVLEDVKIETNTVSGSINAEEDTLLVMSIPYLRGWTAYVDGTEVPILKTNLMYSGIPVSKGAHQVEMRFAIKGLKQSYIIMAAAAAVYLLLLLVRVIRRKRAE